MLPRSSRILMQLTEKASRNTAALTKTFSTDNLTVVHDDANSLFYIKLGEDKAFIQYEKDDSVVDLQETEVPVAFQGKGVGKILAKAAFDHIVKNDLKMKVTCSYLKRYIKQNALPEYTSRIVS